MDINALRERLLQEQTRAFQLKDQYDALNAERLSVLRELQDTKRTVRRLLETLKL